MAPAPKKTSPTAERERLRREEKLAAVAEQVEAGTLVVRQMTDAERERHGPPRPPAKGKGRRPKR
jgi:hypothetical protein